MSTENLQLGHLYLGMSEDKTLDMGVQKLTDGISVNTIQTPIVTYTAENAPTYDISSRNQFTITITRNNPDNSYDPLDDAEFIMNVPVSETAGDAEDVIDNAYLEGSWDNSGTWCNRLWKKALTSLINRWQAKTDGNRMTFIPVVTRDGTPDTEGVFQHKIVNANVYLKTLTFTYGEYPEAIDVNITLVMGTMSGKRQIGGI